MESIDTQTWHGKLFAFSYTVFEAQPPADVDRWSYWVSVTSAAIYLLVAFAIFVTLNIGTLPFGVLAEPIWRPQARFRRLQLPNGLPVIPFALSILLAYASYRTWLLRGPLIALGPWFFVAGCGLAFLSVMAGFNKLRAAVDRREETE